MSAYRLNCPAPAFSRSARVQVKPAPPALEFPLSGKAKLLVEATDLAAAQAFFSALLEHSERATSAVVQLSPGLCFAQVHPSGRYWTFEYHPMPHSR